MEKEFIEIIEKARGYLLKNGYKNFCMEHIEDLNITQEDVLKYVNSKEEMVEKILEYERSNFEQIFKDYNFEGQNAIDILFIVSQELNERFEDVSPSVTMDLEQCFPKVYAKHLEQRMAFVYNKIKLNVEKGISQGMYRSDLSSEIVARMYLAKLEDMHNPELYPPERFRFGTVYNTMINEFVKSIATSEGLSYFQRRRQFLGVLSFGR